MEDIQNNNLPGEAISYHKLFMPELRDGVEVGVTTPDNKYYEFKNGEKFAQIDFSEIPGSRVSILVEADGRKRLFEDWALEQ